MPVSLTLRPTLRDAHFPYRTPENQMPQVTVVLSTEQASLEKSKA